MSLGQRQGDDGPHPRSLAIAGAASSPCFGNQLKKQGEKYILIFYIFKVHLKLEMITKIALKATFRIRRTTDFLGSFAAAL